MVNNCIKIKNDNKNRFMLLKFHKNIFFYEFMATKTYFCYVN